MSEAFTPACQMANRVFLLTVSILLTAFARTAASTQLAISKAPEGAPLAQGYQVRLRPAGTDSWQNVPVYALFHQHDHNWAPTTESQFVTLDSTGNTAVEVTVVGQTKTPNVTRVRPREIDDPLVNPYCGWGIWAGPRFYDSRPFSIEYNTTGFGDDAPLFNWVLIDWMWADLEPKEGEFDWKGLDTVAIYWKTRGKQLVVRLWVTTDPGWSGAPGNKVCPDWLWDSGVKCHEYKAEGGVTQKCPAYADPSWETIYVPKLKRFLTAYRDRYRKPGNLIILDHVMGFGDWGEWHTMWSHYPWPSREKKREVLAKAIGVYLEIFSMGRPKDEPFRDLVIAQVYDDDCAGGTPLDEAMRRQSLDLAVARGLTFTRNGFIDGMSGWPNDLISRFWSSHTMVGEANWSYEQVKKEKTHGTMAEFTDAFARWHSTYAHMYLHADSYKQAMAEDRREYERALRPGGIGYRFVLTSAAWESSRAPGQTLTLRQEWANRNASWCVYPYRLKLFLADSSGKVAWSEVNQAFDPRRWLAGATYSVESIFRLPTDLKSGTYDLLIALVDATGKPQIRLGIECGNHALLYRLGSATIVSSNTTFPRASGAAPTPIVLLGQNNSASPSGNYAGIAEPSCNGLQGRYYNGPEFNPLGATRNDASIDFQWHEGGPAAEITNAAYSARWLGMIKPRYSENYAFQVTTDWASGSILWVNNQRLIVHRASPYIETGPSATIRLQANEKYDLKLQ